MPCDQLDPVQLAGPVGIHGLILKAVDPAQQDQHGLIRTERNAELVQLLLVDLPDIQLFIQNAFDIIVLPHFPGGVQLFLSLLEEGFRLHLCLNLPDCLLHQFDHLPITFRFQQIADTVILNGRVDIRELIMACQENNLAGRPSLPDPVQQLQAADARHPDIRQDDVKTCPVEQTDSFLSGIGFIHVKLQIGKPLQNLM
ncbi:hypothetical protein D3C76_660320 [compost metagenome]